MSESNPNPILIFILIAWAFAVGLCFIVFARIAIREAITDWRGDRDMFMMDCVVVLMCFMAVLICTGAVILFLGWL